ncbi:TPA: neurogenic locus notch [Legionella pneumophila]|nr:neurogenic locus notch [Legionella pneumophila]
MLFLKIKTNQRTTMNILKPKAFLLISVFALSAPPAFAVDGCCSKMGGINYCDSSAGRLVCNNGFYSTCYCTRHAVMDLQFLMGCCLWHGGVYPQLNSSGLVVCNDGYVSEECSLQKPVEQISVY